MARPKKYFSAELAEKAERLLRKFSKGKQYIRLLAISCSAKQVMSLNLCKKGELRKWVG
jgi:hypothetical protein